jgi:hypothetical protein
MDFTMLDSASKPPAPHPAGPTAAKKTTRARTPAVTQPAVVALALAALTVAGCSTDLSRSFGFVRDAPDEYTVTTQVPLSMPPEFNIRPPVPGASRPQAQTTQQQAEEALVPQTALTGAPSGAPSSGQAALVAAAGPTAPTNIRAEVNGEARAEADQSHTFVDTLMFWREPQPPGIVVDPKKEAQRIRENAALGRTQEAGDTPIIQPRRKSWLESIF